MIDRSFVVDMMLGPEGLALVSTIINLAHSLRLKVVAEGVRTEEQARLLHAGPSYEQAACQGSIRSQVPERGAGQRLSSSPASA